MKNDNFGFTRITFNGQEQPDFGFRNFVSHLNDYDPFRMYAPCYFGDTAHDLFCYPPASTEEIGQ